MEDNAPSSSVKASHHTLVESTEPTATSAAHHRNSKPGSKAASKAPSVKNVHPETDEPSPLSQEGGAVASKHGSLVDLVTGTSMRASKKNVLGDDNAFGSKHSLKYVSAKELVEQSPEEEQVKSQYHSSAQEIQDVEPSATEEHDTAVPESHGHDHSAPVEDGHEHVQEQAPVASSNKGSKANLIDSVSSKPTSRMASKPASQAGSRANLTSAKLEPLQNPSKPVSRVASKPASQAGSRVNLASAKHEEPHNSSRPVSKAPSKPASEAGSRANLTSGKSHAVTEASPLATPSKPTSRPVSQHASSSKLHHASKPTSQKGSHANLASTSKAGSVDHLASVPTPSPLAEVVTMDPSSSKRASQRGSHTALPHSDEPADAAASSPLPLHSKRDSKTTSHATLSPDPTTSSRPTSQSSQRPTSRSERHSVLVQDLKVLGHDITHISTTSRHELVEHVDKVVQDIFGSSTRGSPAGSRANMNLTGGMSPSGTSPLSAAVASARSPLATGFVTDSNSEGDHSGSRQASKPASRQASKPASRQASKPVSRHASKPVSQAASKTGSRLASRENLGGSGGKVAAVERAAEQELDDFFGIDDPTGVQEKEHVHIVEEPVAEVVDHHKPAQETENEFDMFADDEPEMDMAEEHAKAVEAVADGNDEDLEYDEPYEEHVVEVEVKPVEKEASKTATPKVQSALPVSKPDSGKNQEHAPQEPHSKETDYVSLIGSLRQEIALLRKEIGLRDDKIEGLKEKEHDLMDILAMSKTKGTDVFYKNTRICLDRQKKAYQILVAKLRREIRRLKFQRNSTSDPLVEARYFPYLPRTPFSTTSRQPQPGIIGNLPQRSSDYFALNPPPPTGNHLDSGNRWWWGSGPNLAMHPQSAKSTTSHHVKKPKPTSTTTPNTPAMKAKKSVTKKDDHVMPPIVPAANHGEPKIGDRVCVFVNGSGVLGIVKYVGIFDPCPGAGLWCGIKLHLPRKFFPLLYHSS
ncbi:hypothetical protein HDU98_001189 [Podochytrium sp. JEL0797]|nr:hypothetical protein HDU98_001189 [Podochytrium sp. JEL0797]